MTSSKKVYVKAYTRLNVGDDLFVFILCARYPHVQFYIKELSNYTDVFKSINNMHVIKETHNINFDAIVYIGGSIFIESSPASISRLSDLKKEILLDNIPTYIIGANFGPYTSYEYYSKVKDLILANVKSTTFRDTYSYNLFKDLSNVHYASDVVFSLDTSSIQKTNKKEIGISIIHHLERLNLKQNYDNYLDKLAEIAKYYINLGYSIRLFSFCEYEKDMVTISDLLAKLNTEQLKKIYITNYTGNLNDILELIASLKLFITSRFHSMILGLKLGIPIIPICYSKKCTNVLEDMVFPKQNVYSFENLANLNYKQIPDIFYSAMFETSNRQFKDLDDFLKN